MVLDFLIERKWLQENIEKNHDDEQAKKMVPLITCETTFGQHVSKLVLGVNIFDLDFGFWSPYQTTSLTQLCGFGIRGSSLNFCL